ncbi:hypothetical protein PFICI_11669 [Pestalotiopsis fici W106-1]|uniref:DUF218 domain-containing protein n=1 Tax=Pestalotiopsis fici (strain W106-1 / CGMCC3.15140) TaxID=1229662 RepID=W3WT27_PESFW|nr:uncharacterized protein PFICI_11669 [Pestalotiopsis fici W106-1]ETS76282.1 hypothetical protein PFICI_11669 [Pestalotiopsis fici W106-1]
MANAPAVTQDPTTMQSSSAEVEKDAAILYDYLKMDMSPRTAQAIDAVFCLCSLDLRVADHAAKLFLEGTGDYLIFSGGSGVLTEGRFDGKPEAEAFADRACALGVDRARILVEPSSTNTGENVRFTWALLEARSLRLGSFVLVQKPYMERRTYATFLKQWPEADTAAITITSPPLAWDEYPDEDNPRDLVINIMVGDLMRIHSYPAKGFQIPQVIPRPVMEAGQRLIDAGYTQHLSSCPAAFPLAS